MIVAFEKLKPESRIWVYSMDRFLSEDEQKGILGQVNGFISEWKAHGKGVYGAAKIVDDRFLIWAVDEDHQLPTGCSIDSSVHFLKNLGDQEKIDFFNRSLVYFKNGGKIISFTHPEIKKAFETGELTGDDLIYNTMINSKGELEHNFLIPVKNSWAKRFQKTVAL